MSNVTLLDPTNEAKPVTRQLATRPEKISGNVALLDISKRQGNIFLDKLEQAIEQRVSGINIKRYVNQPSQNLHQNPCVKRSKKTITLS